MTPKTKEEIINELYATKFVDNYAAQLIYNKPASSVDRDYIEDIVAELYLIICELPATLVTDIYNGCGIKCFRSYVSGIIHRQIVSTSSKIYKKYIHHRMMHEAVDDLQILSIWAEKDSQIRQE